MEISGKTINKEVVYVEITKVIFYPNDYCVNTMAHFYSDWSR